MKIAPRTMSRILKDDLRLAAYKRRTGHFLTHNLKKEYGGKIETTTEAIRKGRALSSPIRGTVKFKVLSLDL